MMLKMAKKGENVKFKNYTRKKELQFMIYADFESILIPEIMESKIQMGFIRINIKFILVVVMVAN